MRALARLAAGLTAGGLGALAWGVAESKLGFTVRSHRIRARAPRPLRILHVSDLHLTNRDAVRSEFVRELAALEPDFVALTGDNFGDATGPEATLAALEPLLAFPGAFVFGSHDYVTGAFKSPLRYFTDSPHEIPTLTHDISAEIFGAALVGHGWSDLNNTRAHVSVNGVDLSLVGVNDPHVGYDDYPEPDGDHGELQVALIHAPYRRVLDETLRDGTDIALCGHTHGGQVCVPFYGALVNNTDLPIWRASGLQGWPGRRPDGEMIEPMRRFSPARTAVVPESELSMWLNVSAGVGTSPHAPVRFACRPEVSLIELLPG